MSPLKDVPAVPPQPLLPAVPPQPLMDAAGVAATLGISVYTARKLLRRGAGGAPGQKAILSGTAALPARPGGLSGQSPALLRAEFGHPRPAASASKHGQPFSEGL